MVGRLFDHLADEFDKENVFRDIYSIEGGSDFAEAIDRTLRGSDVVLVLIGSAWLAPVGPGGRPRIEDPADFVRVEIETALGLGRRVIPIRVEHARLPARKSLPATLAPLLDRQAMELADSRWEYDVGRLIDQLHRVDDGDGREDEGPGRPAGRWLGIRRAWLARGLMAILLGSLVGLVFEAAYPLTPWSALLALAMDHLIALTGGAAILAALIWFVVRGARERPKEGLRRVMRRLHGWSERRATVPILLALLAAAAATMWWIPEGVTITERSGPLSSGLRSRLFIDTRMDDDRTQQCPGDRGVGGGELAFACRYYEIRVFTGLFGPPALSLSAVVTGTRREGGIEVPASVSWADGALERVADPQWVFHWEVGGHELKVESPRGSVPRLFRLLATRQHDADAPPTAIRVTVLVGSDAGRRPFQASELFEVRQ
jgi:hypothetical protein